MKSPAPVANPVHGLDQSLVLRALLVQLVEWVCNGVEPPPSRVPRRSDGTAVSREEVLSAFHGVALPDVEHLPWTPAIDADSRTLPLETGEPPVALVSAVDAGGNEVAGIRLPAVAAGTAAFTGWNPRAPVDGLPDVLYEMVGSLLPPQVGAPDRAGVVAMEAADRAGVVAAMEAAADGLVADRFLLPGDRDRAVAEAMRQVGASSAT